MEVNPIDVKLIIEKQARRDWPPVALDTSIFKQEQAACAETTAIALALINGLVEINSRSDFQTIYGGIIKRRNSVGGVNGPSFQEICSWLGLETYQYKIDDWSANPLPKVTACRIRWAKYGNDGVDKDLDEEFNRRVVNLSDESHVVLIVDQIDLEFLIWEPNFSFETPFVWWPKQNLLARMMEPMNTNWNSQFYTTQRLIMAKG